MPHILLSPHHLGQLLRHFRTHRRLTQARIAARLYVNVKTIGARENATHDMPVGELLRHAAGSTTTSSCRSAAAPAPAPPGTGWPT